MRLLQPLRRRDFALLFAGSTISLVGDGVYTVALAFQVYALDNSPGALSLVLLAYSAGLVVCALVAGVVVDRVDRRAVIVVADALQLVAILAMGLLSVAGTLEVWHCALLAVLVGAGTAFVKPAATALLPHVVPKEEIVAATSLEQSAQQASYALLGPALGGVLVGATGPGTALVIDAATFAFSIGAVSLLRTSARPPAREEPGDVIREIREGIAYVRRRQWLWGTLLAACIAVMCVEGPIEIALPYVIKNDWGNGAGAYGALLAVAGFAGIGASLFFGARGLPRKPVTAMMLLWSTEHALDRRVRPRRRARRGAAVRAAARHRQRRRHDLVRPAADARARRAVGPRLEPGLDALVRTPARLLRAHGPARGGARCPRAARPGGARGHRCGHRPVPRVARPAGPLRGRIEE